MELERPRWVRRGSVATAAAALALSVAATSQAVVPDPYFPADGNVGYDVRHYDVHDRYRFRDGQLSGVTKITLVPSAELSSFSLDFLLEVDAVRVDGEAAGFEKSNRHELVVTPAASLAAGDQVEIRVRYHGYPGRVGWGGERNWLANKHEVVTMNEPHMAAWWFPSNDHPSDKARFDIRVTTRADRRVISNGVRVGRKVHGATATTHWRMSDPMTTYLAFFAAGDFAVERGRADGLRYYNAVSRRLAPDEQRHGLALLRQSARVTAWLARELGDYPFASTGGLMTSLQVLFALENQTRPTYPVYPTFDVVVHELAHQWFGNSVSLARWQDIWLNEGFASYMETRYREAHGGVSTDRWLHNNYRGLRDDPEYWELNIADPCGGSAPCSFDDLFAPQVYNRGAMALAALRNRIGRSDFLQLLRRWVSDYGEINATAADFEDMAEAVSGLNLESFFDAWLRGDTPPPRNAAFGL